MPLNDPVPSSSFDVAKRNASDFDSLLQQDSGTVETRTGKQLLPWQVAMQRYAAYNNTGPWVTGTAYQVNDLWQSSGTWYVVLAEYTSGATPGDDIASGNVQVWQVSDFISGEDTIADLRNLEPLFDGQQIELLGHTVAGIGGGIFYADFSDTTSPDDNGTVIVTPGGRRWKRKLNGFVTPEMFGAIPDGTGNQQSALQAASDTGLTVRGGGRDAVYRLTSDWLPASIDGKGCTFKTVNCAIRLRKGTGDNQNTEVKDFQIDDTETTASGDGCLMVEKGDMWKLHLIDARGDSGFGRKGLVIRPFEDFAWVENLTMEQVKFSGFDYNRYVEVPNFSAVFINQVVSVNCEFRNSGVTGMYVDTSATTVSAQKVSAWTFIGDEFDGGGQTGDDLIFLDTLGGVADVEAWTFINAALEDTTTLHTGYCVNSNDFSKVTGFAFIGTPRFNYAALINPLYSDELLNTFDAQSPNCKGWRIDSPTVTNEDSDGGSYSGVENFYTGRTTGNSSFSPGQTRTALTLPQVDSYRDYELTIHPVSASDNSAAQVVRVISGPGGAVALALNSSSVMTASISGSDLQITNTDATTKNVRYSWRYYRSSE